MEDVSLLGGEPHVVFLAILLVSVPLAVILSLIVLRRYRKAVLRSMMAAAQDGDDTTAMRLALEDQPGERSGVTELPIQTFDHRSRPEPAPATGPMRRGGRARRRAALVYGVAGALHAAIATTLLFLFNDIEFLPVRTASVWFLMAWPVVPTLVLVAVGNRYLKLLGPVAFLAASWLLSPIPFVEFMIIWAVYMGMPTLFLLAVGNRRLRAVGPILLVVVFLVVGGMLMALNTLLWLLVSSGNLDVWPVAVVIGLTMLGGFGLAAWRFLRWIARRFQRKQSSDQMLLLDAWWLLFTLWQCIFLSIPGGLLGLLGLLAFAGYRLVLGIGLRPLHAAAARLSPARLLLLRVFGFRRRSEHLLDELGLRWRYAGSVQLIAGPDLATANLEPHEFLEFLGGRLERGFIKDAGDLEQRLREMDLAPDPDGRFRINEFFCHDDTWRLALKRLAAESDGVLMDLRGFSPANRGCLYELRQLLELVPLPSIILTVDGSTDEAFLTATLDAIWSSLPAGRSPASGPLRILRVERQSPAEVRQLGTLLDMAVGSSPHRQGAAAEQATAQRP
ncbi:hypothetical protein [Halomonas sp. BM-2019]|uniref:hypothetical protein n=1 Tax=Halomonas sp. BM-2019 TaxID=2811227 RepID=UPI001B3C4909|nr:MAG: hypothetical protein J5F18_09645 [Halomonas sp. BM-2019]